MKQRILDGAAPSIEDIQGAGLSEVVEIELMDKAGNVKEKRIIRDGIEVEK